MNMKGSISHLNSRLLLLIGVSIALLLLGSQNLHGAGSSWFEFTLPWDDGSSSFFFTGSSPITQPIRVGSDDNLHLGSPTGQQIRLFGVSMGGAQAFPTHAQAEKTAARLAKLGFNLVRLGPIDSLLTGTNPITFDSTKLDQLFYFIAQLKAHGIYVALQLIGFGFGNERPTGLFDPAQIQLQKDAARKLLEETTLYGITLKDDPVLALVQFDNETSLFTSFQICELDPSHGCNTVAPQHLTPDESAILDQEWNDKLLTHYGDRATLESSWSCSGKIGLQVDEDPATDTVKRIEFKYSNGQTADVYYCHNRLMDEITFYYQVEQEFVVDMMSFLTGPSPSGLGLEIPITTMENFYGVADKMVQALTNAMAQHSPWAHPWPFTSGGFMVPPFTFLNWPMTKGPAAGTPPQVWVEWRSTIWRSAVTSAVKGKPYIISEYNHPLPNEFQAEFPLLISAYALFQGWDGIILHEYANKYAVTAQAAGEVGSGVIEQGFELADDPAVMAQIPAAAHLFRNGWVQEGSEAQAIDVPFWEDGVFNGASGALDDWWKCHGDYYCYWENTSLPNTKNINPAWSLVHKLRMKFTSGPEIVPSPGNPLQPYASDTGELHWNMAQGQFGLVTIDTPWVNAAIGSVDTNPQLSTLKLSATTNFAAVSLIPLDSQPLASSQRLLLTSAGRLMNTGMDPAPPRSLGEHTLNSWGGPPVLLEPVEAQVTLTLPQADQIRVYRLDETGNKGTEIPVSKAGNDFTFSIGSQNTLWYGIEVGPPDTAAVFRVTKEGNVFADRSYYGSGFNSGGADIAEHINVSESVEPGDLVELDPQHPGYYRKARSPYSTLAAGVISTQPGMTMGGQHSYNRSSAVPSSSDVAGSAIPTLALSSLRLSSLDKIGISGIVDHLGTALSLDPRLQALPLSEISATPLTLVLSISELERLSGRLAAAIDNRPLLALMGTVPVKATTENGPIRPGDLLVPSSTPGYVMRCANVRQCEGAIVGKALEPLGKGKGIIQMLVMR